MQCDVSKRVSCMPYEVFARSDRLTHDEWLAARRTGLGGSDAGAIMGVHPYKGAYAVWADKKGLAPAVDDNEAMRQGRDMEEYVARRFTEKTGLKVRRDHAMMRSIGHPCMIANIDRRVSGCSAGLECKTSRDMYMTRYKDGLIPMEYYCQCVHYMAVTGWAVWYLAVLVYGTDVLVYKLCRKWVLPDAQEDVVRIEVDDEDIAGLIDAEESYWANYIEGDLTPMPDALEATGKLIGEMYAESDGEVMDADEEADDLLGELVGLKAEKKQLDERIRAVENQLKATMGTAEVLRGTNALVTWKAQERRTIDAVALVKQYPQVHIAAVTKVSTSRVFKVKEAE